jgi:hypothetical protein
MTWDEKCWGIFNNIYWEMRFAGLQGIKLTPELANRLREQNVVVPKGDRVASVSWTWLRERLKQIESELDARTRAGTRLCCDC